MISILHLLWVVPLSAVFGFFTCALCTANREERDGDTYKLRDIKSGPPCP